MPLINICDLTFSYDNCFEAIFEKVSVQIDTSWKLGLTGRNGRGKTTLLHLLSGRYEYSGTIFSPVIFDYFPFEVEDPGKKTAEIIMSILPEYDFWKAEKELSLLEVPEEVLSRPFQTLSNGEQTKVLIAALCAKENHFLLIDEPTNHLDMEGRRKVSQYLKSKKGFVLVSHDRTFLDQCIDHVLSINKSDIEIQKGNFSTWQYNKALQDQFELSENEKRNKEIKNLSAAAKRTSVWSDRVEKTKNGSLLSGIKPDKGYIGHKAEKMMRRSKSIENRKQGAVEEKKKLLKNIEIADSLSARPLPCAKGRLMEADHLSIHYGEKTVIEDVSVTIHAGDRIALVGKNGSGKSSILKVLAGENIDFSGNCHVDSRLIVSYIPQSVAFLDETLKEYAKREAIDESLLKTILRKLDFSKIQLEKSILDFSEGQKKKVLLASSLCRQAHVYIWDEPLNFVDVISRIQIEEWILKYNPTMIFVEHDYSFYKKIATKEIVL